MHLLALSGQLSEKAWIEKKPSLLSLSIPAPGKKIRLFWEKSSLRRD